MKSVALYARVSSEQQAQRATIESKIGALRERALADGHQILPGDIYTDDGFSGATLIRPALERLRDRIAESSIDTGFNRTARTPAVYASQPPSRAHHARLALGWWPPPWPDGTFTRGSQRKVSDATFVLLSRACPGALSTEAGQDQAARWHPCAQYRMA